MADEPSNGELSRLIQLLRGDIRDDMAQINARLDRMVSAEVYAVEKAGLARDISELTQVVEGIQTERAREKEMLQTQRTEDQDRVTQTRRWMVATVITVLVAVLPYLASLVKGASA